MISSNFSWRCLAFSHYNFNLMSSFRLFELKHFPFAFSELFIELNINSNSGFKYDFESSFTSVGAFTPGQKSPITRWFLPFLKILLIFYSNTQLFLHQSNLLFVRHIANVKCFKFCYPIFPSHPKSAIFFVSVIFLFLFWFYLVPFFILRTI